MAGTLEAKVDLTGGMAFNAETGSGHSFVMDSNPDVGGAEKGPRPMEVILAALGGCTGMDVISILRKMRQDVTGYEVRLRGETADEHPRVFTKITVEHVVRGRGISEDSVKRAVELSATRYCPASAMLGKTAQLNHVYRIVAEAGS